MIVRTWRGRVRAADAERYFRYLEDQVFARIAGIPGHRGVTLCRRADGVDVAFLVLSRWDSMDAIRAYAGDTPQRAVVASEAAAMLAGYDETVDHYEVVLET